MRELFRNGHLRRWSGTTLAVVLVFVCAAAPVAAASRSVALRSHARAARVEARPTLVDGVARAVSVASADCNRDGRADVVAGYDVPDGGVVAIYAGTRSGLATEPVLVSLPVAPDFLVAGDVNGDGRADIVAASRGASDLLLLRATPNGDFSAPEPVHVAGSVTALASGQFGGLDGRTDVAVGVSGADGSRAVVLSLVDGVPLVETASIGMPAPVQSFAFGQFDASSPLDLAIAAGDTLSLVHGERFPTSAAAPQVETRQVGHSLASIDAVPIAGSYGSAIAMLYGDGSLGMLQPSGSNRAPGELASWDEHSVGSGIRPGATRVFAANTTGTSDSDLVVIDPVLSSLDVVHTAVSPATKSSDVEPLVTGTEIVAAVALRLNGDALSDVVAFGPDSVAPIVRTSSPRTTFTVVNTNDTGAGSLRDAITLANASSGADLITFAIPGSNFTITPASALPTITEAVTIDGTTQPGFAGTPIVEIDGSGITPVVDGLAVTAASCTIRGLVINLFKGAGVKIDGANNNIVEGCYIGTDPAGAADLGNGGDGVLLLAGTGNAIGGPGDSANLISGNGSDGVHVETGIAIGNTIAGNKIGTNAAGTAAIANSGSGVALGPGAGNNTVGGLADSAGNLISGNGTSGVAVGGADATGNLIENNTIGEKGDGSAGLPNGTNGVSIGAFDNTVFANRIAFNNGAGILCGPAGTGNMFTANSIDDNGGLGIDLMPTGSTPNDSGDADGGPNGTQNFPVLTSATVEGTTTTIVGMLSSMPSTQYRIEFFSSPACDPSGFGEGATFLGFTNVTTSASGNVPFTLNLNFAVAESAAITATATNPTGSTSEFSACVSAATDADISVTQQSSPDPVPTGSLLTYTITITNAGPLAAANVMLLGSTPSGTTFQSITASSGTFETPGTGGVGAVTGNFGTLGIGASIVVTYKVLVIGPAGQTITNTVFAGSSTPDPNTANNTSTESTATIEPPVITSITKLTGGGKPFRVKITGSNLQPGVAVIIGTDIAPWPDVKYKDSTMIVLRKGGPLKAKFPKGVPVQIEVRNPDGGVATATFTR